MGMIQYLQVDQYGAFISKHSERLIVVKGKEKLIQAPLIHLESVLISNHGVSISSDAIQECTERGIPIYFISHNGAPYASLYSAGLTGTVITRRAQYEALQTIQGLRLVLSIGIGKMQNQSTLLKYMSKYRKGTDPTLFQELRLLSTEILDHVIEMEKITQRPEYQSGSLRIADVREEILGIEGRAAQKYWRGVKQILPERYGFPGRVRKGAKDPINSALNYGYGILYGQIERSLVLAGLDPFAGFLHIDRPGKPSLTLDFIEEFRPVAVDRVIFGMANKNMPFELDGEGLLTRETRLIIAEKITERLESTVPFEGKQYPLRNIMQMQARHVATFLRGEKETYTPLQIRW